jgi:GNAT superfamily N-acetyltransferase
MVQAGRVDVRAAAAGDAEAIASFAAELATSFAFSPESFRASFAALLAAPDARVLLAADGPEPLGYLLGFRHLTFYANGAVAWVEEIFVRSDGPGHGTGRALIDAFEQWAVSQGCALVALATRRAAPFYRALDYAESASYFRKLLTDEAPTPPSAPRRER